MAMLQPQKQAEGLTPVQMLAQEMKSVYTQFWNTTNEARSRV